MSDRSPRDEADLLDAGLRAAFGAADGAGRTVLERLGDVAGDLHALRLPGGSDEDGSAPVSAPGADPAVHLPPTRGNYRVLGELARGGVGVVLRGHDSDLGRDVALKVLQERHAGSPEVLQRFVEEAQIGGQLQHPGIVPVYEMGLLEDSRPFFTMKLVKGRTLASLLEDRERPEQDQREFLRIFEAVCQTLAYAHSRGVIHRDVKPSNVMVGSFGEVQLVDWGLAKVIGVRADEPADEGLCNDEVSTVETIRSGPTDGTGGSSQSVVGSVLGTPSYMSPEQALGRVRLLDERSDVFALGGVLCKILTGSPPYSGSRAEVLLAAGRADLGEACSRLDRCGADPELVSLAKDCLARVQLARPRDAARVAARIHEYQVSVEERARAAQLAAAEARVRAENERRARRLTLALALAVIAVLVVGGVGWNAIREQRAERVAAARQAADRTLSRARDAAESDQWGAVLASLDGLPAAAGLPESAEPLAEARRLRARATAALESRRLADLNETLFAGLEEVRRPEHHEFYPPQYAAMDESFAAAFRANELPVEDVEEDAALDLLEARHEPVRLAARLNDWAHVRRLLGRDEQAARLSTLSDRLDDDTSRTALREATDRRDFDTLRSFVDEQDLEVLPAVTLRLLAQSMEVAGDSERELEVLRRAQRAHRDDFLTNITLARKLVHAGRGDEALPFYEVALALRPESAETRHLFGIYLHRFADRVEDARELFQQSIDLRPDDAHLWYHLGQVYLTEQRIEDAIEALDHSLLLDPDYAEAHGSLGEAYLLAGDLRTAELELREALALEPDSDEARVSLGAVLIVSGEQGEGVALVEDGLAGSPRNAKLYHKVGWAFSMVGDWARAQEALEDSVEIEPTREALDGLSDARAYQQDFEGAIEACDRSLAMGPTFGAVMRRAALARQVGDRAGARAALRTALQMRWDDPYAGRMYVGLLTEAQDWDALEEHYRERLERAPDASDEHNDLAWFLATRPDGDAAQLERALEHASRAVELVPDSSAYLNTLALVRLRRGDWAEALEAARRRPSDGRTADLNRLMECIAESHLGRPERARALFAEAEAARTGTQDPLADALREQARQALQQD